MGDHARLGIVLNGPLTLNRGSVVTGMNAYFKDSTPSLLIVVQAEYKERKVIERPYGPYPCQELSSTTFTGYVDEFLEHKVPSSA